MAVVERLQACSGPSEHFCLADGDIMRWGNCILLGRMGRIILSVQGDYTGHVVAASVFGCTLVVNM